MEGKKIVRGCLEDNWKEIEESPLKTPQSIQYKIELNYYLPPN